MRRRPRPLLAAACLVLLLIALFSCIPQGEAAVNTPWHYVLALRSGAGVVVGASKLGFATRADCTVARLAEVARVGAIPGIEVVASVCVVDGIVA